MDHESSIGVGLIGCGTVGSGVARLLSEERESYARRLGRPVGLRRVLVRDVNKRERSRHVDAALLTDDLSAFLDTPDMPIVIEVAGGRDPIGDHVRRALTAGKHVVTANKSLLAAEGVELFALARRQNVCIAFEASCGGGIPIVTTLQFGLSANRFQALYGILNGTCNYILTEMTQGGKTYAQALEEAQQEGFAEADPTLDISGQDAAEKLAILASLAFGVQVEPGMVGCEGIDRLDLVDIRFGRELGYEIKLLAIAERCPVSSQPEAESLEALSVRVDPCFIHAEQPMAQIHGSFNALASYGHAVGYTMHLGRGAGQMPTASAVVADLLNVASGWYPESFARLALWPDQHGPPNLMQGDDVESRFYLRFSAKDEPGVIAQVGRILGDANISMRAMLQHEIAAGQFVPIVIVTHGARRGAVTQALDDITELDVIEGTPICIPIVDMPEG